MKKKKQVPLGVKLGIDLLVIVLYVGGFYGTQYLIPREVASEGIKVTNIEQTSIGTEMEETTITDINEEETTVTDTNEEETSIATASAEETISTASTSGEVVSTYSSDAISITVTKETKGSGDDLVTYYVADVYINDITCLQAGFADDTYGVGYTENVLEMDESLGAILAINGDYYGNGSDGVVIRNGEVYRSTVNGADVCVLYYDGTMKTYTAEEFDVDQAIADGAYQAWSFGPMLLDAESSSMTEFTASGHVAEINPRTGIGYYEPGHYCFVVVDGRQSGYSAGMTLTEFSALFEELGCTAAYNLDGGKSSEMSMDDAYVNQPCDGGREVSDCVYITEVE